MLGKSLRLLMVAAVLVLAVHAAEEEDVVVVDLDEEEEVDDFDASAAAASAARAAEAAAAAPPGREGEEGAEGAPLPGAEEAAGAPLLQKGEMSAELRRAYAILDDGNIAAEAAAAAAASASSNRSTTPCTGSSAQLPADVCARWQAINDANQDTAYYAACKQQRDDPCSCNFFAHRFCPAGVLTVASSELGPRAALGADGWWGPFARGEVQLLEPIAEVLAQRAQPVLLGLEARALHPLPGPLVDPPQVAWGTNLGHRSDILAPERVLAEIEHRGGAVDGGATPRASGVPLSRRLVNIGAVSRGVAGRSNPAYVHRLYKFGYAGPAIDSDERALRALKDAFPAVEAFAVPAVTPLNVRALVDAAAAHSFGPSLQAAKEAIARVDGEANNAAAAAAAAAAEVAAEGGGSEEEEGKESDGSAAAAAAVDAGATTAAPPQPSEAASIAALAAAVAVAAAHAPHADLLHVGTGTHDCALVAALLGSGYRPKVIVLEVNFDIPPPIAFAVHYSAAGEAGGGGGNNGGFAWKGGCFYGCSLSYASAMLRPHGYTLLQLDVWDALYVADEFVPLFGAVPHDDYSVWTLRPPLLAAANGDDGSSSSSAEGDDGTRPQAPLVPLSVCHNASAVLANLHPTKDRVDFLWRYFNEQSGGSWPFTLDVDPVPSQHDDLAAVLP